MKEKIEEKLDKNKKVEDRTEDAQKIYTKVFITVIQLHAVYLLTKKIVFFFFRLFIITFVHYECIFVCLFVTLSIFRLAKTKQ